ncbi:MAG: MBL fold metallo-hydrolase [bacterium]|nr:MBL fold metallo-hydrolase [bacterium]
MVRVTVLGSGDAFGSGGRFHSAYLVETPGATFLLDCGPSILQALKRARVAPDRLDFVLLTHFHGDHFAGVPFLFMDYRYESRRTRPFTVFGPPQVERRVRALFSALYEKTADEPSPFPVAYRELATEVAVEVAGVRVTPLPVPHVCELVSFAYRIEAAGRTLVYSGDTAWTDDLVRYTHGADLFVCECSTWETKLDIHVSYPEVATHAPKLGCKRLLLTHLGSEPLARLDEITLEVARDGMTIEL